GCQGSSDGGNERPRLEHLPLDLALRARAFPGGQFALCIGAQQQVALAALGTFPEPEQGLAPAVHGWIRIVTATGPVNTGKYGLQCVVIALRDGIEFVVVAPRALD